MCLLLAVVSASTELERRLFGDLDRRLCIILCSTSLLGLDPNSFLVCGLLYVLLAVLSASSELERRFGDLDLLRGERGATSTALGVLDPESLDFCGLLYAVFSASNELERRLLSSPPSSFCCSLLLEDREN